MRALIAAALMMASGAAAAHSVATVTEVVDGDTLRVDVHVWPHIQIRGVLVRLAGMDAPELRSRCQRERVLAREARSMLQRIAPVGTLVRLYDVRPGKYSGRVIARVRTPENIDPAEELLREGLARPYSGRGPRKPWCQ